MHVNSTIIITMKFVIFVLILGIISLSEGTKMRPITETTADEFPYLAYVKTKLYCVGALVSLDIVVVIAYCLEIKSEAKVYLGAQRNPSYSFFNDIFIDTMQIIEGYTLYKPVGNHNDGDQLGLIKLWEPVTITPEVRPAILPMPWDFPIPQGTLLTVTGYMQSFLRRKVRFMTVNVRSQESCRRLYNRFNDTYEQCGKAYGERLDHPGPFVMDDVLVGIGSALESSRWCVKTQDYCSSRDVFVSLGPFLKMIYQFTEIPWPITTKATTTKATTTTTTTTTTTKPTTRTTVSTTTTKTPD